MDEELGAKVHARLNKSGGIDFESARLLSSGLHIPFHLVEKQLHPQLG